MAGVLGGCDGTAVFGLVDRADVVMTKLYQYKIARFQRVIDAIPASFVQIRTTAATCHGSVDNVNLGLVEDGVSYGTPTPHAVRIFVGILHRAVACDEDNGLAFCASQFVSRQLHVTHHGLQWGECGIMAGHQAFSSRTGIHHCAETAGMNLVEEEMIVGLPLAIAVKFLA